MFNLGLATSEIEFVLHFQGIRIKDAASKQKARELLAAEQAMREMEVDAQPPAPKSALDAMTE